jgi:hypothetical protein
MGVAASKPHSPRTPKLSPKRASHGTVDDAQAAAPGTAAKPLGTTAELGAARHAEKRLKPALPAGYSEMTDCDTGEIFTLRRVHDCSLKVERSLSEKRVARYERKAAAASVLGKRHRIAACHANPIKYAQHIEVWAKRDAALPGHFRGLQTCSLSWLCAVCAPKIAERRAAEIEAAMVSCKVQGGQILMPTFTVPHGRKDPLAETLDRVKKAMRSMGQSRQYRNLQAELRTIGRVTATEITHGEANGWHPHMHELWFFEAAGVDVPDLELRLYRMWRTTCVKFGLGEPSRKHGVVVQDGSRAAAYVSKMGDKDKSWSLSDEMAKASAKGGRKGSRSAWELLDCVIDTEASPTHQKRAAGLFKEYAQATKGRRQLSWSPGLKKRFAIVEMDDEELAAVDQEDAVLVANISLDDWRAIRKQGGQAGILNAAQFGPDAVRAMVSMYVAQDAVTRDAKGVTA